MGFRGRRVLRRSYLRRDFREGTWKAEARLFKSTTPFARACRKVVRLRPPGPHPRIRLALPSSRGRFGIDSTLIRHRFPDFTLSRCQSTPEEGRTQSTKDHNRKLPRFSVANVPVASQTAVGTLSYFGKIPTPIKMKLALPPPLLY